MQSRLLTGAEPKPRVCVVRVCVVRVTVSWMKELWPTRPSFGLLLPTSRMLDPLARESIMVEAFPDWTVGVLFMACLRPSESQALYLVELVCCCATDALLSHIPAMGPESSPRRLMLVSSDTTDPEARREESTLPVPRRDESFLRTAGRMELMSESRKDRPPGSPEPTVERTSAPVTGARG